MLRHSTAHVRRLLLAQEARSRGALGAVDSRWFASDDGAAAPPPAPPPSPPPSTAAALPGAAAAGLYSYEGPFASTVRKVKALSLFSCACAVGGGPVVFALDSAASVSAKLSVAGTLAGFGVLTTGLCAWFVAPYVQRLTYDPAADVVEVETLTLLNRPRRARFAPAAARPADTLHPLSTFAVGGRYYFLDPQHFGDKALLARLAPGAAAAQLSAQSAAAAADRADAEER
jgi:hypothetical protein